MAPPTAETEGLRDLLRCRDDLRGARTAARHRVSEQLLRHGRIYREGKHAWTVKHRDWVARQRLDDSLAHAALEEMLVHLDSIERQLATLDARLEQIARSERWAGQVQVADPVPRDRDPVRAGADRRDRSAPEDLGPSRATCPNGAESLSSGIWQSTQDAETIAP